MPRQDPEEENWSSPSQTAALHVSQFAPSCLLSDGCCCAALPTTPLAPLLTLQQSRRVVESHSHMLCTTLHMLYTNVLLPYIARELCCLPATLQASNSWMSLWECSLPARSCKGYISTAQPPAALQNPAGVPKRLLPALHAFSRAGLHWRLTDSFTPPHLAKS